MTIYYNSITLLLALSIQVNADEGLVNKMSKIDSYFGEYANYCGQDNWKEAGWNSEKSCLTDGRVHLVYSHNNKGEPNQYALSRNSEEMVEFSETDKATLLDAIYEGAQIYVGEATHIVLCVDSAIYPAQEDVGVCSTTDRIYSAHKKQRGAIEGKRTPGDKNASDSEFNRYMTDGHREYNLVYFNDVNPTGNDPFREHKIASRIITLNKLRWYIRY